MNSIMEGYVNSLDTEKFINAVKQHPSIWDMNHEDHSDRGVKKLAWDTVISAFVADYEDKSSLEKKNMCNAFSRKWKSLRDCYSRELGKKRRESLSGSQSFRKEYVYFEHLKFLGALRNNSAHEDDGDLSKDIDYDPNDPDYHDEPPLKRVKRFKEPKHQNGKNVLKNDPKQLKAVDPDRLFMLSLVPEMKRVPEHLKLEVKTNLLAVFTNLVSKQRTLRNDYQPHNVQVYGGGPSRLTVPTVHVTVPISINYDSPHLQGEVVTNLQELNPTICKTDPGSDVGVSDRESDFSE